MIKHISIFSLLLIAHLSHAQVAVNSTGAAPDVNAMLDVSSNSKGILIPRLTNIQMMDMAMPTGPTTGMMVFNTSFNTFYFFNGSDWQPVGNSTPDGDGSPSNELQTLSQSGTTVSLSDGGGSIDITDGDSDSINELQNLTNIVSGVNRTINISDGTGTTFSIADTDNDPSNELQTLSQSGTTVTLSDGGGSVDIAYGDSSPTNELDSKWTASGANTYLTSNGNVGIGTSSPGERLSLNGDMQIIQSSKDFGRGGRLDVLGQEIRALDFYYSPKDITFAKMSAVNYNREGNGWFSLTNRVDAGLSFFVSNDFVLSEALTLNNVGNMGVGTTAPTRPLDVDGQVRIRGGAPTSGKVLTATDSDGNAEWQAIPASPLENILWVNASDGIGLFGHFGAGTTEPTRPLDVVGQVRIRGGGAASGRVLTATDSLGNAQWQALPAAPAAPDPISIASKFYGTEHGVDASNSGWKNVSTSSDVNISGVTSGQSFLVMASFRCGLKGIGSGVDDFEFRIGADNGSSPTFTANSESTGNINMIDRHRDDWIPISFQRVMTINHTGNIRFNIQVNRDNSDDNLYVDETQIIVIKL